MESIGNFCAELFVFSMAMVAGAPPDPSSAACTQRSSRTGGESLLDTLESKKRLHLQRQSAVSKRLLLFCSSLVAGSTNTLNLIPKCLNSHSLFLHSDFRLDLLLEFSILPMLCL
ncbi:hypothetical protein PIB30_061241 [Stylosanthes scabra]|uniref:Uncharacterized protein n=1 Tax=Stylosanthes scabra TaxID=79078 RepID=A0ABU6VKI7_9FABA|nr:hypothetical protein [Stylosanthes scabra]